MSTVQQDNERYKNFVADLDNPNIMIDLESGSLEVNAAILSIGATTFSMTSLQDAFDKNDYKFYVNVDRQSCIDLGMITDEGTLEWWSKQAPEVVDALQIPPPIHISRALLELDSYIRSVGGGDARKVNVWCKGTSFDIAVLKTAYKALGRPIPWNFRYECDMRTLLAVSKYLTGYYPTKTPMLAHHALEDAKMQASNTWTAFNAVKKLLGRVRESVFSGAVTDGGKKDNTVKGYAERFGAWEDEKGHVCFGSWQAFAAMCITLSRDSTEKAKVESQEQKEG